MANVHKDHKGWRIETTLSNGGRKVIRMGSGGTRRLADEVAARVRALEAAQAAGSAPDASTAAWLSRCGERIHARLVAIGLAPARERDRPLVEWMDAHLERHAASIDATAGTRKVWGRARSHAGQFFGSRLLSTIRASDAAAFRAWLLSQPGRVSDTLAEATVRKTCGVLSQCCQAAVKAGTIASNPFEDVPKCAGANHARECYVEAGTIRRLMAATPDRELRLLLALSRFAGIRVPSEVRGLRWGDVDWAKRSLRVDSPKTRKQGKPWRLVPIVPEVLALLEQAFHEAPEGAEFILPTLRLHTSPAMPVLRAARTAGIEAWPRTFHALRASCETDWAATHPIADVAAWMGHSRVVAAQHYLRATDSSFALATGGGPGGGQVVKTVVGQVVVQSAARSSTEQHATPNTPAFTNDPASPCISAQHDAAPCRDLQTAEMDLIGLEPTTSSMPWMRSSN